MRLEQYDLATSDTHKELKKEYFPYEVLYIECTRSTRQSYNFLVCCNHVRSALVCRHLAAVLDSPQLASSLIIRYVCYPRV